MSREAHIIAGIDLDGAVDAWYDLHLEPLADLRAARAQQGIAKEGDSDSFVGFVAQPLEIANG